jgi:hypothetical protein
MLASNKQIRAALLTAKGVQVKAVPSSHGIDNVHTVIDPATVDHPAADIPGVHLRAGRMGKAGGGDLRSYRATMRGRMGQYDPNYYKAEEDPLHDEQGQFIATRDRLEPLENTSVRVPIEEKDEFYKGIGDTLYRGMSHEEYENFLKTGTIQSQGQYNIGDSQKGLTYFTTSPKTAESYANSFAPEKYKPTFNRPAYIVAIKRPANEHIRQVKGTGEHEFGIARPIEAHEVKEIYRGKVVAYDPGEGDSRNGVSPTAYLHWEKIKGDALGKSGGGALAAPGAPALSSRVTDRRIPELQNAADMVAAGQMGPEEYHAQVGNLKPVRPYTSLPPMATREDLLRGLSKDKHGKIGAEEAIPEGHAVGLRLDIPAYNKHGVWAPTIHEGHEKNSKPIAHAPFAHVSNPVFSVDAGKALGVARGNEKAPFAKINGFWKKTSPEDAQAMAQEYLNHPEWRQVGMDPERHSFFYDRETRQPVESADEALQIGPLVLAKNPKYGSLKDFQYEQGGRVGYAGGGGEDDPTVQKALGLTQESMLPPAGSVLNHGDTYVGQNAPTRSEAGSQAGGLPFGGSLPGGEGVLSASHQAPLEGLPSRIKIPQTGQVITAGPNHLVRSVAARYMQDAGLPYNPPQKYAKVDLGRGKRIADEYERMEDNASHPLVKAAYDAMIKETMAQYQAARAAGLKLDFWNPDKEKDPYEASPRLAIEDVNKNHHMYMFPTSFGFGSKELSPEDIKKNPLLVDSGERWGGQPVLMNDIFRAVHDYFGHAKEGSGFRSDGEENAWRSHASMYSPLARLALTSETRGQNSWLNFGPHGEKNRNASTEDTVFAPQKVGIMPAWTAHEGAEDFITHEDRKVMEKIHKQYGRSSGGRIGYGTGGGEDDPTVRHALSLTKGMN